MNKEQLAEQYAEGKSSTEVFKNNHIKDFLAGFSAKEEQIKEKIKLLERSKGFGLGSSIVEFNNQQEQVKYAERVDEVIKILKSLINEN